MEAGTSILQERTPGYPETFTTHPTWQELHGTGVQQQSQAVPPVRKLPPDLQT